MLSEAANELHFLRGLLGVIVGFLLTSILNTSYQVRAERMSQGPVRFSDYIPSCVLVRWILTVGIVCAVRRQVTDPCMQLPMAFAGTMHGCRENWVTVGQKLKKRENPY